LIHFAPKASSSPKATSYVPASPEFSNSGIELKSDSELKFVLSNSSHVSATATGPISLNSTSRWTYLQTKAREIINSGSSSIEESLKSLLKEVTVTPASVLGTFGKGKGVIEVGAAADLVFVKLNKNALNTTDGEYPLLI
jgi:hypothetical protein